MWEEHPEYQKFQARMVGIIVLTLFVLYAGFAIVNRDWDLLKNTLLLAGALVAVLGMLSGMAWLVVKIFTRGRTSGSKEKKNDV
jgi:hypothetical protein